MSEISLWKHQKAGVKRAKPQWVLAWEEGTGKTFVYLECLKKFGAKNVLLIAPAALQYMWRGVLDSYPLGDIEVELTTFDKAKTRVEEYRVRDFDAVVVDEGSKIKRWESKRSRQLSKLSRKLPPGIRLIGTGTPIGNKQGAELFSYAQFLFGEESPLGNSFVRFRDKYFEEWEPLVYELKEGAEERLHRASRKWVDRLRKADCLSLPEKVYSTIRLRPLKGTSRKAYDAIKKHGLVMFDDATVVESRGAATTIQKLLQLTCGVIYPAKEDDNEWLKEYLDPRGLVLGGDLDDPKSEWILEFAEVRGREGSDVLIVGRYTKALELIANKLEQRGHSVGRWYADYRDSLGGDWKYLVASEAAIAFGHNLQRVDTVIFQSNTFSLEERRQTENRAHRAGQKKKVTVYDLIVEGVDSYVVEKIRGHSEISKAILRDEFEGF